MTDAGVHPPLTICAPSAVSDTLDNNRQLPFGQRLPAVPLNGHRVHAQASSFIADDHHDRTIGISHLDLLSWLQCLTLRYRKRRPPIPRTVVVDALRRPFGTPSCSLTKARHPHRISWVRVVVVLPTGRTPSVREIDHSAE